eukprot:12455140-Heterocapsa_arctica.AAC.1
MDKHTDSDHTDQDSDDNYPGHKVSMGAYSRMMENPKDKIFQQREEAEVDRKRNRNKDHKSDKQGLDQVHRYVHE